LARELARRGHGVTLVARREDRLRALASELADAHHIRAEVVGADLTDPDARGRLPDEVAGRGLTVDVLVNNAGFSTTGPAYRADRARETAMVRTDVEAVVDLCTLFLPGMVQRGRGAVLNVASTAAFQPIPGQAAYAASKAFVLSYSHAVRAELAGTGVTVTALCPGPVATEFVEAAGFADGEAEQAAPRFMWVPA
jgi:short-subunit dehydrogenase